ncbi:MAG: prenyltransferase [Chloroflexi bacterium]|nr:prenyltransferase [Chloroflexota bacterium]
MFLKRWLALSRTRLFVAVVMPAVVGAAVAFYRGHFSWPPFALLLFGLVMAESANLLFADWAESRGIDLSRGKAGPPPVIEGSPMLPQWLLPLKYALHGGLTAALLAGGVFIYFAWHLGWPIVLLAGASLAVGSFYVVPPVRYGFFSTALLPPVIAFGTYYVLSRSLSLEPLLAALPLAFVAAATIFTYRVLYSKNEAARFGFRRPLVKLFYMLCYLTLLLAAVSGGVSLWALLGMLTLPLVLLKERYLSQQTADYLPATSVGVLVHSTTGGLIALGYMLSAWL